MLDLLLASGGLALLLAGGWALVQGASRLAAALGVPPAAVGLTVVAFGTSAPELAVNLGAVYSGNTGIAFGNVVGSNIANVGLILGLCAVVRPLVVESRILTREIPLMVGATLLTGLLAISADGRLVEDRLGRSDGLVLLLVFVVTLALAVAAILRGRPGDPLLAQAGSGQPAAGGRRGTQLLLILGGLGGLAVGAELFVTGAAGFAAAAGVPDAIIGLTVVAVGTSMPELVTSLVAVLRGQVDIAVGNVVGSNVFNLLFILGLTSTFREVPVPDGGVLDLLVALLSAVALFAMALTDRRRLVRWEGAALLAGWIAYVVTRVG